MSLYVTGKMCIRDRDASATAQKWADQFAKTAVCPECHGAKLNKEADVYKRQYLRDADVAFVNDYQEIFGKEVQQAVGDVYKRQGREAVGIRCKGQRQCL